MSVLIADADFQRGKRIATACEQLGLRARLFTHGAAALEGALLEPPLLLIAQLALPLIDGAQLGGILRANPRTRTVGLVYLADNRADAAREVAGAEIFGPKVETDALAARARELVEARDRGTASRARSSEGVGGVEGDLSQLPLADLLQLFHVSQKSGVIALRRGADADGAQTGRVALRAGEVICVELDSATGEKALYRMLAWDRGQFAFAPGVVTEQPSLGKPTRALLQEGLRQNQEWARCADQLPPLDASVHLKVRRSSLPVVIQPLTQEVLLVLEAYSRVSDVVDHCSFPDYLVLRTLHTLIERGMVELRDASAEVQPDTGARLFSDAPGVRLREWMGLGDNPAPGVHDARLLVVASDPSGSRELTRLVKRLPGAMLRGGADAAAIDRLGVLGRLAVDDAVGIEFVEVPADSRFAAIWPLAGHGCVAILLVLTGPVSTALEAVRPVVETLRGVPRARIFHLLLLEKDAAVEADALRENLSIFDDSSLFLIPIGKGATADVLLREMFLRILP
ncbi:MAG TPA: DUF4388 domain-containing protein [Myxococcota bacterium]|nr:DUF4388 domain-containing protein [Myxococcota bacterium]